MSAAVASFSRPSLVTPALVRAVLAQYRLPAAGVHGPAHWLRVAENGAALAARTPGADAALVEAFALIHDSRRLSEGEDRAHGDRAAEYCRDLSRAGLLRIAPRRLAGLMVACMAHEQGTVSDDPTMGCCWDADRLELARLSIRPRPELLSTEAAKGHAIQAEAWERGRFGSISRDIARRWGLLA